jgi:hypothetical protein
LIVLEQDQQPDHSLCQFKAGENIFILFGKTDNTVSLDKEWLDRQYHSNGHIKKPDEVENEMQNPPKLVNKKRLDQIQGSLLGMAIGDALGAHVEFRPHKYLLANPVTDLEGGGTWGLRKGQVLCHYSIYYQRNFKQGFRRLFFITKSLYYRHS